MSFESKIKEAQIQTKKRISCERNSNGNRMKNWEKRWLELVDEYILGGQTHERKRSDVRKRRNYDLQLQSEINDQWSPKMWVSRVPRANCQEAMYAWKDGQFKPKGNGGGMYREKGNRRSLRMVTGNFRLWLMIGEVRLAGWVFDCQENKKEDDPELFQQGTNTILVKLTSLIEWLKINRTLISTTCDYADQK